MTDFLLGVATGIALYFFLDVVRDHQRRKQRERDRKAARAWKL